MISIKNLNIEYKFLIIFGILSLIMSLLIGIISGIDFSVITIRMLIFVPIFAGLGYGIAFVLKRYIPELYQLLAGLNEDSTDVMGDKDETGNISEDISDPGRDEASMGDEVDGDFTEFNSDDFTKLESVEGIDADKGTNISNKKLGKHIISKEKIAKYEPKLMAEAIRTMMSRDED